MRFDLTRRTLVAGAVGAALVVGAGLPTAADAETRTLRLSHHLAPGHLVDVASKRFAELVAEKTNGAITVEVFPSGQIAGLRQGAEAVQVGTVDVVWSDFGTLANWRPEYGFVSLPFLFRDNAHFDAVFGGEVGKELAKSVADNLGVEVLGYGNAGFRVIATRDRAVKVPEDMKGVRIRVPEVPIFIAAFRSVGANPTPMAWGEVYTALQTGVIDAVENPAEGLAVGNMQDVTKHLSRTYHIMTDVNLFTNAALMAGLPGRAAGGDPQRRVDRRRRVQHRHGGRQREVLGAARRQARDRREPGSGGVPEGHGAGLGRVRRRDRRCRQGVDRQGRRRHPEVSPEPGRASARSGPGRPPHPVFRRGDARQGRCPPWISGSTAGSPW